MRTRVSKISPIRGSSLVEAVIAVGVLAVAIPLVFGALAESGNSNVSSEAETRSTWIIPACMEEILASREGKPQFFTATTVGQVFPPSGEIWALAFSAEGKPIGKITQLEYDKGLKELNGQSIRYIATLASATTNTPAGAIPMLRAQITLEYPSALPVAKRQKLQFYTRIP
ncbi:MAG: type IV pilus modification PilV family protein [Luteolibacter sp.]